MCRRTAAGITSPYVKTLTSGVEVSNQGFKLKLPSGVKTNAHSANISSLLEFFRIAPYAVDADDVLTRKIWRSCARIFSPSSYLGQNSRPLIGRGLDLQPSSSLWASIDSSPCLQVVPHFEYFSSASSSGLSWLSKSCTHSDVEMMCLVECIGTCSSDDVGCNW